MPSRPLRRLETVVAGLQLRYGPRSVYKAATEGPPAPSISTTFVGLDTALGIGGLPRGRLTEISGPATSGKVTLAAKVVSMAHRERGAMAAWIDLSRTCDPDYLHRCGVDLGRLLVVHPEERADAPAIALHLVESNTLAALVFDGMADLLADVDLPTLEGTLERLAAVATQGETAVIFLSEPRSQYRTLAHLAALRLEIRRERWIQRGGEERGGADSGDVRGYEGLITIVKHKLGRAGATVPIRITFNGTVRSDGML